LAIHRDSFPAKVSFGMILGEERLASFTEPRHLVWCDMPNYAPLQRKVAVNDAVAKSPNLIPRYFCQYARYFRGEPCGGVADDHQVSEDRVSLLVLTDKLVKGDTAQRASDRVRRVE
jgi:hypothetical protein